jgi:hypothetical protein
MELTKDDVRAIRLSSDRMTLHSYVDATTGERVTRLGVYVTGTYLHDPEYVFTVPQQTLFPETVYAGTRRRFIDVPAVRWEQYAGAREQPHAFTYAYPGMTQTLAHIVRAGDRIGFRFVADNNNDALREAGFHHDEAYVMIERAGKVIVTLMAHSRAGLDNSARMIVEGARK